MIKRRMRVTLVSGAILGVFCVIGANIRSGGELSVLYLFSFWFNRLLMGFVFGLLIGEPNMKKALLRGAIVGLFVSFAFYSSTDFNDLTGFLVGAIYGVIIEFLAIKFKQ